MMEHAVELEERRIDAAMTVHFGSVDWAAVRSGTCLLEASTRNDLGGDGSGNAAEFDRRLKSLLEVSGHLSGRLALFSGGGGRRAITHESTCG
jgi:hypothetical protein